MAIPPTDEVEKFLKTVGRCKKGARTVFNPKRFLKE